jgi:hypothetical protein
MYYQGIFYGGVNVTNLYNLDKNEEVWLREKL